MIAAKDLRIGNYLHTNLNDTGIVAIDINHLKHIAEGNFYSYKPIPLTAAILEAAGFEPTTIEHASINRLKIYISEINSWYHITSESGICEIYTKNIKQLHHLQNLYYALTGEELTINLESVK